MQATNSVNSILRTAGTILCFLLALAALVLPCGALPAGAAASGPLFHTMTVSPLNLPTGPGIWNLVANGFSGQMSLTADTNGNVTGWAYSSSNLIQGFYDPTSAKLTFMLKYAGNPTNPQIYTGYLFYDCSGTACFTELAGTFDAFASEGGLSQRNTFGWYAVWSIATPKIAPLSRHTVVSSIHHPRVERAFNTMMVTPEPLPSATWRIDGNGYVGPMSISVDSNGNVTGTAYGNSIFGFYDSTSGKITFMRLIGSDPTTHQIFTGYLFRDCTSYCVAPAGFTLAGTFEAFSGTGASAQRSVYGWYAKSVLSL
jgi:hypothetical protein